MRTHLNTRVYGSLPFNDVQRWIEVTSDSSKDEAIDSKEIDSDETRRAILCFLHALSPWTEGSLAKTAGAERSAGKALQKIACRCGAKLIC